MGGRFAMPHVASCELRVANVKYKRKGVSHMKQLQKEVAVNWLVAPIRV
jgi:hypothetical protein